MMPSNPVPMKNIHEPFDAKSGRHPDDPEYIPEIQKVTRRTTTEIIDLIYDVLPVRSKINVTRLAEKAGLDWTTTKRHLDLIEHIQSKQKDVWLIVENVDGQRLPIYGRNKK